MARFGPTDPRPTIAVAVSGGGDSMALTILLAEWLAARDGRLIGLTVDHGLRAGSGVEAAQVASWFADRGLAHEILTWSGGKPTTGVQAAARQARYDLMERVCRQRGIAMLALAHTLDDQLETVLMRRCAGSGADGLAGMAARRETRRVTLLRPLLGIRHRRLLDYLNARNVSWLEDPSNRDARFARVGVRRTLAEWAKTAPDRIDALRQEVAIAGRRRAKRDRNVNAWLRRHANLHAAGFATLDFESLQPLDEGMAVEVLRRVTMSLGGGIYAPNVGAVARLWRHLSTEAWSSASLANTAVCRTDGELLVYRERRNLPTARSLHGEGEYYWDRFRVTTRSDFEEGCFIAALGIAGRGKLGESQRIAGNKRVPPVAQPVLPALWRGNELVSALHLDDFAAENAVTVDFAPPQPFFQEFCPFYS